MEAFRCYLDRRFSKTVRIRYVPDKTNPNAYFVYHGNELIRQVERPPQQSHPPAESVQKTRTTGFQPVGVGGGPDAALSVWVTASQFVYCEPGSQRSPPYQYRRNSFGHRSFSSSPSSFQGFPAGPCGNSIACWGKSSTVFPVR